MGPPPDHLFDRMKRSCEQAGIPQDEIDRCRETHQLIELLRKANEKKRKRIEYVRLSKRKGRNEKEHDIGTDESE